MRQYELTVLIHPDLEIDLEKPLKKVRDIITNNGGTITKEDNWGKKKLAYRIKNEDFATYVYFELELPAEVIKKVDSTLNITDEVLRHLLVANDPKRPTETDEAKEDEPKEG
ncbi:MAG TPA: 30S ribosomal protein S6 [Candidatus Saccharimonadales bacterium]